MKQAARVYFETQVTTTSQGQILIMLYDGAIKFLTQAKERIDAKDYAGKGKLISSAIDVINELASSLNADKGGDLAANLSQLYFYCNKRLFMANSRMDTAMIDEVIKILGGIRSAYAQIVDTPEAVAAMAQAPAPSGKGPRTPMGTQACPAGGAPIPAAKARNAYASQSRVSAGTAETSPVPAEETAVAEPQTVPESELPVAEARPGPEEISEVPAAASMPDLSMDAPLPPPSFTQGQKLAASNLYKKFTP